MTHPHDWQPYRAPAERLMVPSAGLRGPGVIIVTGPSSCGKGEISNALCELLSIPHARWLSMGNILRGTYERAAHDAEFRAMLTGKYRIASDTPILDCIDTTPELVSKVEKQAALLNAQLHAKGSTAPQGDEAWRQASQLDWLELCTVNGLLVPDRWTQALIAAHIESLPALHTQPFLIDGYPRTKAAAAHLLEVFGELNVPVLKVLHLSISKQEMLKRAGRRQRVDDNQEALLKRYAFYIDSVQPSVDFLKDALGSDAIALIDAHQPHYDLLDDNKVFNLQRSIRNVVYAAALHMGLPRVIIDALIATRASTQGAAAQVAL
ncbi:Adenylate kinase [Andreprevotia lacus DSM 23236]|jgi:adenylate kinase family enzyme|uniref:Adenylate kinase n=1 Tax=Andreprevotia lacus DSM 23236 TaxID=1121001 RepID=A0A1W1XGD7_9NEIS|nr:nucleoside monophosphate kinase [Andreprevotia lacus]SMC23066.1 Adenylate kinase [Andreprevotia lacus DSM 23236]